MGSFYLKEYDKPYRNLYDTLVHSANLYQDKIAVIDDNAALGYGELLRKVDLLADYLVNSFDLKAQDQVGLMMVNHVQFVIAFYAVAKINCIAVMVNTKFQKEEIDFILEDTSVKAFFCDSLWWKNAAPVLEKHGIRHVVSDQVSNDGHGRTPYVTFEEIWQHEKKENSACEAADGDLPVVIMHTSGTTGNPKGIMLTQKNILQAAYGYASVQGCNETDVTVLSVSMIHILGLSCVLTYFMYIGGTVVLSAFFNPEDVLKKITRYRATHFHSVPTVYIQLIHAYDREKYDLSSLKIAVCGGAPIQEKDIDRFCMIAPNASFRFAYGMTETAGSGTLSYAHRQKLRAVPNVGIEVAGPDGKVLEAGEAGEILFKGCVVAKGVWNKSEGFQSVVHSGDIGVMNEFGEIVILDRIKDIINRGGEKIFPSMVENVLMEAKGVKKAVVFGINDDLYGEVPAAVLVPNEGEEIDLEAVKKLSDTKLAKYKRPVLFEIWENVPVTANGKIRKDVIKKHFQIAEKG